MEQPSDVSPCIVDAVLHLASPQCPALRDRCRVVCDPISLPFPCLGNGEAEVSSGIPHTHDSSRPQVRSFKKAAGLRFNRLKNRLEMAPEGFLNRMYRAPL